MNRSVRIADRYRALVKVNEIALGSSTISEVFQGMCAVLRKLLPFDRAALTLYDPRQNSMKIESLFGPYENSVFRVGYLLPRNSSQSGWTFEHQVVTIRHDLAKDSRFPSEKYTIKEGYRSTCSVPLIVRRNSIGAVTIVGTQKNQFYVGDARLAQEISNHTIIAIMSMIRSCPVHPNTQLLCPKCIGAVGGKATVSKHRESLSNWGKTGGRGHKKINIS
jgi:formate hydrogenlyase transcriptional activator